MENTVRDYFIKYFNTILNILYWFLTFSTCKINDKWRIDCIFYQSNGIIHVIIPKKGCH